MFGVPKEFEKKVHPLPPLILYVDPGIITRSKKGMVENGQGRYDVILIVPIDKNML